MGGRMDEGLLERFTNMQLQKLDSTGVRVCCFSWWWFVLIKTTNSKEKLILESLLSFIQTSSWYAISSFLMFF
jgi:hypothetical protein